MVQGIEIGNKFFTIFISAGKPVMFGVGSSLKSVGLSRYCISRTWTSLLISQNSNYVATANLAHHHIKLPSMVNQTSSVFIIDYKAVAFTPVGQHILLLDSHCYSQRGVYIAMAPSSRIWELVVWNRAFSCIPCSQGTVSDIPFKGTTM